MVPKTASRVSVRAAVQADIPALTDIKGSGSEAIHRDRLRDAQDAGFRYLVLLAERELIGFACLVSRRPSYWSDADDMQHLPQIIDVQVKESHRGQGYGSDFIHALEHIAAEGGSKHIYLSVEPENNPRAYALYRRLGYQPIQSKPYRKAWRFTDSQGTVHSGEDWVVDLVKQLSVQAVDEHGEPSGIAISAEFVMLKLVEPSLTYKNPLLEAVREFHAAGEYAVDAEQLGAKFEDLIARLAAKDPLNAPPGELPYEDFWLMEGDQWIGKLTLRTTINARYLHAGGHIGYEIRPSKRGQGYGTKLLRMGLEMARARGLQRVLLTCDETNIASRKVIENNGGQLENAVEVEGQTVLKMRYWINLDEMESP